MSCKTASGGTCPVTFQKVASSATSVNGDGATPRSGMRTPPASSASRRRSSSPRRLGRRSAVQKGRALVTSAFRPSRSRTRSRLGPRERRRPGSERRARAPRRGARRAARSGRRSRTASSGPRSTTQAKRRSQPGRRTNSRSGSQTVRTIRRSIPSSSERARQTETGRSRARRCHCQQAACTRIHTSFHQPRPRSRAPR